MELQEIPQEKARETDKLGTSEEVLVSDAEEEAEQNIYTKLQSPSEDIYEEAHQGGNPLKERPGKETQTQGNVRVYRALCVLLSIICLVLLLVIIILAVKFQAGATACPEGEMITEADARSVGRSLPPQTCSFEKCQALFPQSQSQPLDRTRQPRLGCQQCADGWLPFDSECYYLSRHRLNWEESQRNCTARGGHLAVITNQRLQSFLSTEGSVRYWIGLRHRGTKWSWANNTVLGVSYWAEDDSKGDCGVLSGGDPPEKSWIKAPCFAHTYYICQLQM